MTTVFFFKFVFFLNWTYWKSALTQILAQTPPSPLSVPNFSSRTSPLLSLHWVITLEWSLSHTALPCGDLWIWSICYARLIVPWSWRLCLTHIFVSSAVASSMLSWVQFSTLEAGRTRYFIKRIKDIWGVILIRRLWFSGKTIYWENKCISFVCLSYGFITGHGS